MQLARGRRLPAVRPVRVGPVRHRIQEAHTQVARDDARRASEAASRHIRSQDVHDARQPAR
eukprot:1048235-Prymnesium_polylepis.1